MGIFVSAIVVAGGSSTRMGRDKLSLAIGGKTVLQCSLEALERASLVNEILLVTRAGLEASMAENAKAWGISKFSAAVAGGASRFLSVQNGVAAVSEKATHLCIHDAARPYATPELIDRVISDAIRHGAAAPVIPMVDTVKQLDDDGLIAATPDRSRLVRVQTPQVFEAVSYRAAAASAVNPDAFDDCQLLEQAGCRVYPTKGDVLNIKITTPEDIPMDMPIVRVGHGYDVHKLVEGRRLVLCGVEVPYEKGLDGHSDADVAAHALMDALLGAAALGDIGKLFPPSDMSFKDIDSMILLSKVCEKLAESGYCIGNVDVTIVAQRPKLAAFIPAMRSRLAEVMGVAEDAVSVKATTEEHLGFTGDGSGIAAHSVSLIAKA